MPGKIKVKVLAGRNLPVMDRAGDTTDAFVEIKFGSVTHKTDVCRKSLNPHWNSTEWYRFEVDESELQDEPLQLRLMDHDTYSANDAIGKVVISLAPLLAREANNAKSTTAPHGGAVMSGWIPVFDTMHGIRGELNVIVKVELFSDFNKYKTSSCGVQFFHCPMIPPGYRATAIHGFVEELVVNDDPEYQWIDKIRTPRASNEARQVAFIKLSNQVQRLVGLKAAELGANAVVGYQQDFDLEGEAGVVARAVGTAVCITPLPLPSQPMNMPPCTQQQLKKYLDILVTDNESLTDLNQYYQTHQEELQKMLTILSPNASALLDSGDTFDDDEKSMDLTRQSSITSYAGSVSILQDEFLHHRNFRHLSEDQTDLNKLLNKESDDSDSSGPLQKIKKIKTNFFTKRFASKRSKKSEKSDKQDDSISIKSNTSETSRLSLVDIKNEFKKLKRLKKPKFCKPVVVNKDDEGEGMASILARSVIHAHTSLACIAETQDSEHSPGSTMRRTSESDPTLTVSTENIAKNSEGGNDKNVPEIRFTSLSNINTEDSPPKRERKISESCPATPMPNRSNDNTLPLPGQSGYFGSVSSALSAESSELESSSDEEDDESSDLKTDTEKSIETTSSVVQSVLNQEANPTFIAQMDKKLDDLGSGSPDYKVKPQEMRQELDKKLEVEQQVFDNQVIIDKCKSLESVQCEVDNKNFKEKPVRSNEASTSSVKDETCVAKPSTHYIKFHNPFAHKKASKSISEPSSPVDKGSFVHRSSKRIKRQLSKLSKSNMIKSISHYSLHPKKKETKTPLSQPGSSSDIPSKAPSDTVLGSPFMSYNDLLSLDKETHDNNKFFHKSDEFDRNKFSMYIGSEPVSRASICGSLYPFNKEDHHDHHKKSTPCLKSSGLVHTAMETMLLDRVQNLLIPTSPSPDSAKNKQFFDDVNEKLGQVEEDRNKAIRKESMERKLQAIPLTITKAPPVNTKPVIVSTIYKNNKDPNLGKSADMIYTDRSHSVASTPDSLRPDFLFTEAPEGRHDASKSKLKKPLNLIHSLLVPRSPEPTSPTEKTFDSKKKREIKPSGLIHTAMETMLMEKVQSVLGPETPEPTYSIFDDYHVPKRKSKHHDELKSSGLVHTAFETMLLDKVQASALGANMPDAVINENVDTESIKSHKDDLSKGLVKTAMETMLLDKFYTSELGASVPDPVITEDSDEHSKDLHKDEDCSKGLVKTAMETILLDKLYTSELGAPMPDPVFTKDSNDKPSKHFNKDDANSKGLVKTAMETMLLDQLYTSELGASLPEPVIDKNTDDTSSKTGNSDNLSTKGLVKTAVETMLLDKLYTSELGTPLPDPIVDKNADDAPSSNINKQNEIKGLTHTAMETILMDKVQSLVGEQGMTFVEPQTFTDELENEEHLKDDLKSPGLVQSAVQTILLDKVQSLVGQNEIAMAKDTPTKDHDLKPSGLVHTAFETILLDKVQSMIPTESEVVIAETRNTAAEQSEVKQTPSLFNSAMQTILMDKVQALLPTGDEKESETKAVASKSVNKAIEKSKSVSESKNKNKLTRQDSIHSVTEKEAPKMSDKPNPSPCEVTKPDHPLGVLETIPSLPEGSIDLDNIEETNISVCDNSHAVCGVNRNEKERRVEDKCEKDKDRGSPRHARHESYGGKDPPPAHAQNSSLNATSTPMGMHRRSSDSDLSVTPKGSSLNTSAVNVGSGGGAILRPSMNSNNLDMLEYPFLTMTEYPPGFIVHIGGTVCARSVKLADGGEGAARAAWWAELRTELRAHARALRCNAVIAYTDSAAICEDVCVLSASGTAAVINLDCDFNAEIDGTITVNTGSKNAIDELDSDSCSMAHVPYSPGSGPYRAELSTCGGCRRARVPTVLLATSAKPNKLISHAKAVTLTAVAARVRRAPPTSEPGARDISDQLPFLEYELHKLLLAKLRMQGANALFSLQTQIAIGERCVMALASGTAVRLAALPPPTPPRIKASENDKDALEIQKALWESFNANRIANGYDIGVPELSTNGVLPEVESEDAPALDLCVDKDACVLELDEAEDVETARALAKRHVNMQVFTNSHKPVIGASPHAFAQVWRGRLALAGGAASGAGERHVRRALAGVAYKLRRLQPYALVAPKFRLELPEDEIQLVVSGAAIPLCDPNSPDSNGIESSNQPGNHGNGDADDDIFALDEEQLVKSAPQTEVVDDKNCLTGQAPTTVSLTSLSHVSGGRIVRRLCALRLLFVRETTAVRELGGLSGFLHTFTCEVLAIVRAYTAALGGNALTSFYITQLMLQDNAHKNQGQCLLSVGGDVVHITY